MRRLYIKQKVFSIGERFTVTDEAGNAIYFIEGSFMRLPKTFRIIDAQFGNEVALVTKKTLSWLPHFDVSVNGATVATIDKEFTLLKPKYRLDAQGLSVEGDWWDMNFRVYRAGAGGVRAGVVAEVAQRWLSWGDAYEVTVHEDAFETLAVAVVVAIDAVKEDQNDSSSAAAMS